MKYILCIFYFLIIEQNYLPNNNYNLINFRTQFRSICQQKDYTLLAYSTFLFENKFIPKLQMTTYAYTFKN